MARTPESPAEERRRELLAAWFERRDERAREELVREYLGLVRALARRYAGGNEPLDDLVQVGSIGLVKALDRFDPERGDFASYAVPTIVGELKRHFRDRTWTVVGAAKRQGPQRRRLEAARPPLERARPLAVDRGAGARRRTPTRRTSSRRSRRRGPRR